MESRFQVTGGGWGGRNSIFTPQSLHKKKPRRPYPLCHFPEELLAEQEFIKRLGQSWDSSHWSEKS